MSQLRDEVHGRYRAWAPTSERLIESARRNFPGGDTRMSAHFGPYPLFIERATGCRMVDADGHEIVDFMNNFTSLMLGHANPAVVKAVGEQMQRGSAYAAPTRSQVALAEIIRARVASIEQLRFTSSGSEATLMTLRCARAFTGKQKIMKMEGGYHGSYELAEVSLVPRPDRRGALEAPNSVPVDASIPDSVLGDVIVCPYNEPEMARALIRKHADELAAVIVEPVLGSMGMIPATAEFLRALREATIAHDVLLVFDEVITLRVADGGAQAQYGVTPDLTALGKIIGGGLPIGAFGGRTDLMRMFHPDEAEPVMHASTFSGNPISMAAGEAAMTQVNPQVIAHMNGLGERLRGGFVDAFRKNGIRGQATGLGSLANIHLTDAPLANARDALNGMGRSGRINQLLHLSMLMRGVASASRLMYCTSAPMTVAEIDFAIDALDDALKELKPGIARERADFAGMNDAIKLIAGSSHPTLAAEIAKHLGVGLCETEIVRFGNENILFQCKENVRQSDVFVVQTSCPPLSDMIIELLIIIDALKHASAGRITAVLPYLPYARSDKKDRPRISITARLIADLLETAGAHRVLTMNLHSPQVQGFFRIPVDQLNATPIVCDRLRATTNLSESVLVASDVGEAKDLAEYANRLKLPMAIIDKRRLDDTESPVAVGLIGDVRDRDALLIDDEIASGGTMIEAARFLRANGARRIEAAAVHPVLSGHAVERLRTSAIERLIVTNTIPLKADVPREKIEVISVAELFADAISAIHSGDSVSKLFA